MNPTYIIVICSFDLYGLGKYRYTFENRCMESPELLIGDECKKIILNTKDINGEDGIAEGRALGISQGVSQGEERISQLNLCLIKEKRYDDLERACQDKDFRERLFEEFSL